MAEKKQGFWGRVFRLTPFRISALFVILLVYLYIQKEKSVIKHLIGEPARFLSLELIEAKAYDVRFQVANLLFSDRYKKSASKDVVIVAIDDRSLAYYGYPFPRNLWGDFIRKMREGGTKAVAFDMVFDTPAQYLGLKLVRDTADKYRELGLLDLTPQPEESNTVERRRPPPRTGIPRNYYLKLNEFSKFLSEKEREADPDAVFAEELKKTEGVVLGWFGYRSFAEVEKLADKDFMKKVKLLEPSWLSVMGLGEQGRPLDRDLGKMWQAQFVGLDTNFPLLSQSVSHFGFFVATPDTIDGTIRQTLAISFFTKDLNAPTLEDTHGFPSLALAAVSVFQGLDPVIQVGPQGVRSIAIGDKLIPTDESGRILINWMGPYETFKYYSIYDVLTDFVHQDPARAKIDPKTVFKGKIVLVGSTAIGAHDMRNSPFGNTAGVEMHANVISNILNDNALIRPMWFRMFDILFIIIVGLLFGLVLPRLSAVRGGILALAFFLGYLFINVYFFVFRQYSFTIVFPLAEILLIYLTVTIYRYATEEREKRFIKKAFEFYLSPPVIDQLMKDPSRLKLGGESKVLTAFFSDIQSFSSFSEKMKPQELVRFLNIYLTEMCNIILSYDGTIDKFEGDAIIAFFGAPIDFPDHAIKACLCAAEIQKKMVAYRKLWQEQGFPEVHMRIGLNTGPMVVGNMGSMDRMDYTIMGDAVNLASRLEAAGKQYKIYGMISEDTMKAAGDAIEVRELDVIKVMGKAQGVKVYELLGKRGEVDPRKLEVARIFEKGLALHWQRYWAQAVEQFQKALALDPNDGPSRVFISRCEEYSDTPPPSGWDGVYEMKTK